MSIVAIIPARGNSKRLPRKNLLPINGVPLVVLAIRCAKEAGIFDEIIVSSEDDEISRIARLECWAHKRDPILSDDGVQTAAVVFDVLSETAYEFDSLCVLNPTSPLRTPDLIRFLHGEFVRRDFDCLMTWGEKEHDGTALFAKTLPFLRTLDFYKMKTVTVPVNGVDINTQEDYERAQSLSSR